MDTNKHEYFSSSGSGRIDKRTCYRSAVVEVSAIRDRRFVRP